LNMRRMGDIPGIRCWLIVSAALPARHSGYRRCPETQRRLGQRPAE
jgi:hypothetical protein